MPAPDKQNIRPFVLGTYDGRMKRYSSLDKPGKPGERLSMHGNSAGRKRFRPARTRMDHLKLYAELFTGLLVGVTGSLHAIFLLEGLDGLTGFLSPFSVRF